MVKLLEIFVMLSILSVCKQFAESCNANKFVKTEGMELKNKVVKTVRKSFLELCWAECLQLRQWCQSINVRKVLGIFYECDLNRDKKNPGSAMVGNPDSDYYELENLDPAICKKIECKDSGTNPVVADSPTVPTVTSSNAASPTTTATGAQAATTTSTSTSTTRAASTSTSQPSSSTATTAGTPTTEQASSSESTPFSSNTPTAAPKEVCQLDFKTPSTNNYVRVDNAFSKDVSVFTLSFWLKVFSSYGKLVRIFSYKSSSSTSMSVGIKSDGITEIMVNGGGKSIQSNFVRNYEWQNIIITWSNSDGNVVLYKNGAEQSRESGMQDGIVKAGGTMYIGQKHQTEGFDGDMVIHGSITDLEMWTLRFDATQAQEAYSKFKCNSATNFMAGNILSWEKVLNSTFNGDVTKSCRSTCPP